MKYCLYVLYSISLLKTPIQYATFICVFFFNLKIFHFRDSRFCWVYNSIAYNQGASKYFSTDFSKRKEVVDYSSRKMFLDNRIFPHILSFSLANLPKDLNPYFLFKNELSSMMMSMMERAFYAFLAVQGLSGHVRLECIFSCSLSNKY